MSPVRCELCAEKWAATILAGCYLCGGCALKILERASDIRVIIDDRGDAGVAVDEEPLDGERDQPWELP